MSAIGITVFFKKCEPKSDDKTEIQSDFGDMKPLNVNGASFIQKNFLQTEQSLPRPKKETAQSSAQVHRVHLKGRCLETALGEVNIPASKRVASFSWLIK